MKPNDVLMAIAELQPDQELKVIYTNYRGEMAIRRIKPIKLWHGATAWHPTPCYLLTAFDLDKGEQRDFALGDMESCA